MKKSLIILALSLMCIGVNAQIFPPVNPPVLFYNWNNSNDFIASMSNGLCQYEYSKVETYTVGEDSVAIIALLKATNGSYYFAAIQPYQFNINNSVASCQKVNLSTFDSVYDFAIIDDFVIFSAYKNNTATGYIGIFRIGQLLNLSSTNTSFGNYELYSIGNNRIHKLESYKNGTLRNIVGIGYFNSTERFYAFNINGIYDPISIIPTPNMPMLTLVAYKTINNISDICVTDDYIVLAGYTNHDIILEKYDKSALSVFETYQFDFSPIYFQNDIQIDRILVRHTIGNQVAVVKNAYEHISTTHYYSDIMGVVDFDATNIKMENIKKISHEEKDVILRDAVYNTNTQTLQVVEEGSVTINSVKSIHNYIMQLSPYDITQQTALCIYDAGSYPTFFNSICNFKLNQYIAIGSCNFGLEEFRYFIRKINNTYNCLNTFNYTIVNLSDILPAMSSGNVSLSIVNKNKTTPSLQGTTFTIHYNCQN